MPMRNSRKSKPRMRDLVMLTLLMMFLPAIVLAAVFNFNLFAFAFESPDRDLIAYSGKIGDTLYQNGINFDAINQNKIMVAVQMNYAPYLVDENGQKPLLRAMYFYKDITNNVNAFKAAFLSNEITPIGTKATIDMSSWMNVSQKVERAITFEQSFYDYVAKNQTGYICIWIDAENFVNNTDVIQNEKYNEKDLDGNANVYCKDFTPKVNLITYTGKIEDVAFTSGLVTNKNTSKNQLAGSFAIKNSGLDPVFTNFNVSLVISDVVIKSIDDYKKAYELGAKDYRSLVQVDLLKPLPAESVMRGDFLLDGNIKTFIKQNKEAYVCIYVDHANLIKENPENNDNIGCLKIDLDQ